MSVIIEKSTPKYYKLKLVVKNCLDDFKAMELQLKGVMDDNMRWQECYSTENIILFDPDTCSCFFKQKIREFHKKVDHIIKVIKSDIKHGFINKDIFDIPVYKFRHKKYSWVNVFEFQQWLKNNQQGQ